MTLGFTKYVQATIIYQYMKENLEYSMIVYSLDYLLLQHNAQTRIKFYKDKLFCKHHLDKSC